MNNVTTKKLNKFGFLAFGLLFTLLTTQIAFSDESIRYGQIYAGGLISHQAEVENLDPLYGVGAAYISIPEGEVWAGRVALEYFRAEQEEDFGEVSTEGTHQVVTGYLEALYAPGMADKEDFRLYIGPGIGFLWERLEFEAETEIGGQTVSFESEYSGIGFLLTGSIGAQLSLLDLMWRVIVPLGSENVTLGSVVSVGVALGPF